MNPDRSTSSPAHEANAEKWPTLVLSAALLLGAVQTIGPAIHSPLAIDEQITYYLCFGGEPPGVLERCLEEAATPPLYFWLARGSSEWGAAVAPGRAREFWLRLPSILAFLGSIVLTARLGDRLLGAGAPAAFLFAVNPHAAGLAIQARPYLLSVFLYLVVLAALVRMRQCGAGRFSSASFFLGNAALPWTHYMNAPFMALEPVLAPLSRPAGEKRPAGMGSILFLLALAAATALPLLPTIQRIWEYRQYLTWAVERQRWSAPIEWFAPRPLLVVVVAALALAARRRWASVRTDWRPAWDEMRSVGFLTIWTLVPAYSLWSLGRFAGSGVAQPRYLLPCLPAATMLLVWLLRRCGGGRVAILLVLVYATLDGTWGRVASLWNEPVRHDGAWRDAAQLLVRESRPADFVLVQSGVAETALAVVRYGDVSYQQYATSRLSDFYGPIPAERWTLPRFWIDSEWRRCYDRRIDQALQEGGRIWIVLAADTEFGNESEAQVRDWLAGKGLATRQVREDPIARVLVAEPAAARGTQ